MVQAFFQKGEIINTSVGCTFGTHAKKGEKMEMEGMKLYNETTFPRMQEEMGPKIKVEELTSRFRRNMSATSIEEKQWVKI